LEIPPKVDAFVCSQCKELIHTRDDFYIILSGVRFGQGCLDQDPKGPVVFCTSECMNNYIYEKLG
jgi:hypothetical protein